MDILLHAFPPVLLLSEKPGPPKRSWFLFIHIQNHSIILGGLRADSRIQNQLFRSSGLHPELPAPLPAMAIRRLARGAAALAVAALLRAARSEPLVSKKLPYDYTTPDRLLFGKV